ncbi:HCL460Cp [Eremothecium sinecaudum]|uniref:HCL460Cp n=1 Tax=Eremothecium sinecaudum TaxID=45286 RepID=A0A109UY48_9SACH|nr:HCL460Cp [Eremothecium sinecaudum]AMD19691.1 HCL460Cp [Eremothecium sinecaudum]
MALYGAEPSSVTSPTIAIPSLKLQSRSLNAPVGSFTSRQSSTLLGTSDRSIKLGRVAGSGQSVHTVGKSVESRVMIDIDSPNFSTVEQKQHEEILNSLRTYFLNNYMNGKGKLSSTSVHSVSGLAVDDEEGIYEGGNLGKDGSLIDDPQLSSVGGDITRELYRIGSKNAQHSKLKNRSYDDLNLAWGSRRGSTASGLNVPGGFRREYIISKLRKDVNSLGDGYNSIDPEFGPGAPIAKVPFLTRNFLEFLYIDGHFAGESFEDDFDLPTYTKTIDERTPLCSSDTDRPQIAVKVKTSTFKAFLLMTKSFMGTGVLLLPNAFSKGGLLFSVGMLLFFSLYSYWCYYVLIRSKEATNVSSFGDIGQLLYGPWMKFTILLSLVLTQVGFSGAYAIFTSKNLIAFIENVFQWRDIPIKYMLLLQLVIFIPLSFIRNVSKLSITSLLANFFIIGGVFVVLYYAGLHLVKDLQLQPEEGVIYLFNPNQWSLFIGTAVFAYEGIGLIIPVQDSMAHPEKFPMVLGLVILTTTILFLSIGTIGYLAYGIHIENVILLNLSQTDLTVNLIQFFYSMAILLSTPLQLFPVIAIIENKVFPKFTKIYVKPHDYSTYNLIPNTGRLSWRVKWTKNLIRSIIVSTVILISYLGAENFDLFVSIVGCFACVPLVYMYPPMLHLQSCSKPRHALEQSWKSLSAVYLDYLLIAFGGLGMLYTSYQCIASS